MYDPPSLPPLPRDPEFVIQLEEAQWGVETSSGKTEMLASGFSTGFGLTSWTALQQAITDLYIARRNGALLMDGEYDIFKKSSAKDAIWVETVQGFEQAKRRLLHYTSVSTDEYLVFDAAEGQFIDVLDKAASA